MVPPPNSKRCASGTEITIERISAAKAIGHGIVKNRTRWYCGKREDRQEGCTPERSPLAQATEQKTAEQHFLGDSGLCEEAGQQPPPTGEERRGIRRNFREDWNDKKQPGTDGDGGNQSVRARPTETEGPCGRAWRLFEDRALYNHGRRHDEKTDDDAGLTAMAAEGLRCPVEQRKDRSDPGDEARPLRHGVDGHLR